MISVTGKSMRGNTGRGPSAIRMISWNEELPSAENRKLILYCDHGGGSMQMARMLGEQGYHVASVVGGYEAMKKISKNYFKNRENM